MNYNETSAPIKYPRPNKSLKKAGIIAAVIVVALIIILSSFSPFTIIPAGHVGIPVTLGNIADYSLPAGFHFKNPLAQIVLMDVRIQKETRKLDAFSKDIQQVNVVATVNFSFIAETAHTLYKTVRGDPFTGVMEPRIQETVKAVFTRYTAENLMGVRAGISGEVQELLAPEMKVYGIEIISVSIEDIDFTDAFTEAVEAKQVAEQTKLKVETEQAMQVSVENATAERRLIEARADAEQREIIAKANAEVVKVQADAAAYARRAEAEAEAEANAMVAASITAALIEYRQVIQWDGKLPEIVAGNATLPILNLNAGNNASVGDGGQTVTPE